MKIRFAASKDKSQILALLDVLGEEINQKRGYSPHNTEATRVGGYLFDEIIRRKDTMIFVAVDHDKLVGLMSVYLLPNMRHGFYGGHIEDVVVSKAYRRKGVGTLLLDAVKAYCKRHNVSVIKLDSGVGLTDAHKFYKKNGGKFTEKMFRFDL